MTDYDVVVIGGGIHGAGVAQAAAAAGYRVLCLEQHSWGWATSSRSSKLIHGGLRYLQTGQLNLVRRCLHERDLLLQLAPELVSLRSFYIPVYRGGRYSATQVAWGLRLYYLLSGLSATGLYAQIPRHQWSDLDGLRTEGLEAVFRYYDGQTDDQQLTRAVAASASVLGADLWCPATFLHATRIGQGFSLEVEVAGESRTLTTRTLVNATGPWVNQVMTRIEHGVVPLAVDLVQGTHLLFDTALTQHCFYVEAPDDGRAVFILPWQGKTLVGTTETGYQGDPADVHATDEEIRYLLRTLRSYFPRVPDLPFAHFTGIRVLPRSERAAFFRSRDTQLLLDDDAKPALAVLYGGKLTDYRATAAQVIQRLQATLGARDNARDTAQVRLTPERSER